MITGENKTKFESYKNKLPKNSLCIIMQDAEDGMIDLMSYDTTEEHGVTTAYTLLRGFMAMLETQTENIIIHGQSAIFKDVEIIKPEVKEKMYSKDNITVLDFNNDK
jgi:hypothetical protein|tara:strand:- start:580 stop:900 length:321 start_codon:yes stop_codon:yes gene_type:complete